MKLNFLPAAKAFLLRFRLPILLTLVVLLLAVGGAYGWRYYQYYTGPEHALLKLNAALTNTDQEQLAELVDFRGLAMDFAGAIQSVYPPASPSPESRARIADAIQRMVLNALVEAKEDKPPKDLPPNAPLAPLPPDFIRQLGGNLKLQRALDNVALVQHTVHYSRAERDFPLLLQMTRTPEFGWRITRIINAPDLVQAFKAAENSLKEQQEAAFAEKNADQQLRMDAQFNVISCTVSAGWLSDKRTALMVIEVMGRNTGSATIHNMNFLTTVMNSSQTSLYFRHLNVARRILPGEQFRHTWTVDLNPREAADARLLAVKGLQCVARPWAMTLGNGEVLHIREKNP